MRSRNRALPTLLCFSHLRWNFVYQRPQHLMSRFARDYNVLFLEEPVPAPGTDACLDLRCEEDGVTVLLPQLPRGLQGRAAEAAMRALIDSYLKSEGIDELLLWYYTPMARAFSEHLRASLIVYDCMDELSAFRGAPPELIERERRLMREADLVFTGGYSLYEAKRALHPNVHAFPSSVDVHHFGQARMPLPAPEDQAAIPHPRLGFYGVIDERLDVELLGELARMRPHWQFVMLGPVVKIDPATLPRHPNLHYLGPKVYDELPNYLAGWDVALMPFALNESTRFISPTKTPEYLAGGCPVVSTPIRDVVRSYGESGVVHIANTAQAFADAIKTALIQAKDREQLLLDADRVLADMSWDRTYGRMKQQMNVARHRLRARTEAAATARGTAMHANVENLSAVRRDQLQRRGGRRRFAFDYLIVGAGFAGSVLAERLAAGLDKKVLIIDRRPHIGGNAYDHYDDSGVLVHRYGPHIFHTNAPRLVEYLSRFTQWRPYEHRVLASVDSQLVPIPINLTTLSRLYHRGFTPEQAQAFLASMAEPVAEIRTSEDVVVSQVGRELYDKFFRGYTRKQWGLDPSQLDKAVTARVPTRTNTDDRYFADEFQQMPLHGYTRLFENMLDHRNIRIMLNTDFEDLRDDVPYDRLIYCGPIDEFFDWRFGKLPYRSLRFRHETLDREWFQPVGVVNYPAEEVPYTRISEYKHLTGQQHRKTSISYEYPSAEGDPYYPVPREENLELYRKYRALAEELPNVIFAGRLGTYRYYNMDQVVGQALSIYNRIAQAERAGVPAAAIRQAV